MKKFFVFMACAMGLAGAVHAREFPAPEIRFVVGYPAGGTSDVISRLMAQNLSKILGVTFIVDNKAGAGGVIAASTVAKAEPDGNTILMANMAVFSVLPNMPDANMNLDPDKDLTALSEVLEISNVILTGPKAPFNNVKELIAYARANPGKLTYGSSGSGSSLQLAAELFKQYAKVDIRHIPYKGGSQATVDLMSGRIDLMFTNLGDNANRVQNGSLKALAIGSSEPLSTLPGVPLYRDALPGFAFSNWVGIAGPAKMDPQIQKRWFDAIKTMKADPKFRADMARLGIEVVMDASPAAFTNRIREDRKHWAKVVKEARITAE